MKLTSYRRKRKKINFTISRFNRNDHSNSITQEPYDSDLMAKDFLMQFAGLALTVGQPLVFSFNDKKLLGLNIRTIEAIDANSIRENKSVEAKKITFGKLTGNAVIQFEKGENSSINLVGKAKG